MVTINKTSLVMDANGVPLQDILHPVSTTVLTISGAAAKTASGFLTGFQVVQLYTTIACYVKFSSSAAGDAATSSDWILPAGVLVKYSLKGSTFISCLQVTSGGSLYVTTLS